MSNKKDRTWNSSVLNETEEATISRQNEKMCIQCNTNEAWLGYSVCYWNKDDGRLPNPYSPSKKKKRKKKKKRY